MLNPGNHNDKEQSRFCNIAIETTLYFTKFYPMLQSVIQPVKKEYICLEIKNESNQLIINYTIMNTLTTKNFNQLIERVLPNGVTYNENKNIFLTSGYTSAAGNTYFKGIRLSDRLIVNYDLGQGYSHLFLNGIEIYGFNGQQKELISSRCYNCFFFNEVLARRECIEMVSEYLASQIKMINGTVDENQIESFSTKLIEATHVNQLKSIA